MSLISDLGVGEKGMMGKAGPPEPPYCLRPSQGKARRPPSQPSTMGLCPHLVQKGFSPSTRKGMRATASASSNMRD